MVRLLAVLVLMTVVSGVVLAGCAEPAPAPAPAAPAAPAKAAEPVAAPAPAAPAKAAEPVAAPAPAAASARKVDYPAKGKDIIFINPYAPGGGTDAEARAVTTELAKQLGTNIAYVNKGGGGTQVGQSEMVRSRPDGYTLSQSTIPTTIMTYVDPSRESVYRREDIQLVAGYSTGPNSLSVVATSPYVTAKDIADAAKAKPRTIRVGTAGLRTGSHLAALLFERSSGVEFNWVHFDGGGTATAALLGGHIDVQASSAAAAVPLVRGGEYRPIGLTTEKRDEAVYPGFPTFLEQGFNDVVTCSTRGILAPGGTPLEIVRILSDALRRSLENPDLQKAILNAGQTPEHLDTAAYEKIWADEEKRGLWLLEVTR